MPNSLNYFRCAAGEAWGSPAALSVALNCSTQRGTYEQDNATAATKGKLLQVAAGRFKTQQSQVFLGGEKGKGGERRVNG